ncbi:LytTR family DNA-binding domain-containing protein [Devosia sp. MC521]|uniref:LytTR family DNA-binding domain-containing protein n=1 Tax=Devosia sp. MC521 TaxID=2759954 RepID=UPI0015FA7F6D|nr:LytTR family DNA-binding domain-containing protein [Devosia sp. MC521]MBJ6987231.1 LytTR family transcriptional regulator [Devosia sp. MC521]QMW62843.1 LytTR family transcriptional regulator [Devosia sp. MC521]
MNHTILQSTLREMRTLAGDARSWITLTIIALLVGMIGPFGSFDLPLHIRLPYWAAVVVVTAIIGTATASFFELLLGTRLPPVPRALVAGSIAGLPVVACVIGVNQLAFGWSFPTREAASLTLYCIAISAAVTVLSAVFTPREAPTALADATPALLSRMPLHQRGRLLHLAVADHYVEVSTDRGTALLLLRLSDAMRETAQIAGLQVHRSHWVALDAVRGCVRENGKLLLELETGKRVPVSRSYTDAVKAAGLTL